MRITVDIPRTVTHSGAEEIRGAFENLGWSHEMSGRRLQSANADEESKISVLVFKWNKPQKPVYPLTVSYQAV